MQEEENIEYLNLVLDSNPDRLEASPSNLLPVIIKSIQDLNNDIEILKEENKLLKNENKLLKKDIEMLKIK